jgi:hypothetical protein
MLTNSDTTANAVSVLRVLAGKFISLLPGLTRRVLQAIRKVTRQCLNLAVPDTRGEGQVGLRNGKTTMFRYSLVLVMGLWAANGALAASWAEALFDDQGRDFGTVPRGPTLNHPFRLTNQTTQTVHIASVRVSCGCVSASALKDELAPGQSTAIMAYMDTMRFFGTRTVTIYVQFDRPQWEEVRLWVRANSRDDVSLTPETLAFGQIKHGASPKATVNVSLLGNSQWQILDSRGESNYVQATVKETKRENSQVSYQLVARLRSDTPVGKWFSDVWLTTNNPSMPRVRVPLMVEIEPALSVSPTNVTLGAVKTGAESERKIIVRGGQPFRITRIEGTDDFWIVQESSPDLKPVHVLSVTLKGRTPGEFSKTLRVRTDLKEEGDVEFQATGQVVP